MNQKCIIERFSCFLFYIYFYFEGMAGFFLSVFLINKRATHLDEGAYLSKN